MTMEIKSERRNLTFGSGEPAISHEEAVEILKEFLRSAQIAEMAETACTSCDYYNNGICDLLVTPAQCSKATCIAEAFYEAGYRKQVEGEWRGEIRTKCDWRGKKQQYFQPNSCSLCHEPVYERTLFCPNCGAKMKGGESDA